MIAVLGLALSAAFAQDCATSPYTRDAFVATLGTIETSLDGGDVDTARTALGEAHRNLLCLSSLVKPADLARFSRDLGLAFFFDQDDDAVRRWALTYRYAAVPLPWPESQPEGHPFRDSFETVEDPILGGPTDKGLLAPKKGGAFANGRPLPTPRVPAEVPLLMQFADAKGAILRTWWQDGAAFPADALGPAGEIPTPKWYVDDAAAVAVVAPPETSVVAAKVETPKVEAPKVIRAPKAPIVIPDVIPEAPAPGAYIDPFADAHRREILREVSERTYTTASGQEATVRTEVTTFVADPSGGALVTNKHYGEWLKDFPEWAPGGWQVPKGADANYLKGWKGGPPPADALEAPVDWVSFAAATAYCGSWGNQVAALDNPATGPLPGELRRSSDGAHQLGPQGLDKVVAPTVTAAGVGFRCAP